MFSFGPSFGAFDPEIGVLSILRFLRFSFHCSSFPFLSAIVVVAFPFPWLMIKIFIFGLIYSGLDCSVTFLPPFGHPFAPPPPHAFLV